jgi:hypothetical protein
VLHKRRRRDRACTAVRECGGRAFQAQIENHPSAPGVRVPRGTLGFRRGRISVEDARRGVHARARGGRGRELPFGGLRQRAFDLVGARRERRSRFVHLRRDSGETPGGNCTRAKRLVQPATKTRRRRSPFVARLEPGRVRRRLHAVREHADRAPRRRGRGRRADVRGGERREGNLAGRRDALPDGGGGGGGGGDWKKTPTRRSGAWSSARASPSGVTAWSPPCPRRWNTR